MFSATKTSRTMSRTTATAANPTIMYEFSLSVARSGVGVAWAGSPERFPETTSAARSGSGVAEGDDGVDGDEDEEGFADARATWIRCALREANSAEALSASVSYEEHTERVSCGS